jgi:1-acyl-sn-glycerol-3-phosphate acyltransferase
MTGALLYALVGAMISALTTIFCHLEIAHQRGRRSAIGSLPPGPLIVVANHTSLIDGVLLAVAGRRLGRPFRMLGTAGVIEAPLLRVVFRRLGFIPVRRRGTDPAGALRPAAEALAAGEVVALYPEGRITRDRRFWPERSKTGAVRLALMTGAPIVPVASVGAELVVSRRRVILRALMNLVIRPRVRMHVGDPIDVRALIGGDRRPLPMLEPELVRSAADQVMARLVAMVADLRGEAAPDPIGVERC